VTAADVKFLLLGTIVAKCTLRGRFELAQKAPNPLNRCPHTIESLTNRVTVAIEVQCRELVSDRHPRGAHRT
jgi:hypothetical protein